MDGDDGAAAGAAFVGPAETELMAADEQPDPDVKAVLAITPFRRLWLALGFSSFGDWLGLLAITALADYLARGNTAHEYLAVAGVFILRLAPAVVLGPLAGALADRVSRRLVLVNGDVLRFVILATVPFIGTLWWLYVATLLIECVGLFWLPAKDATMPNLVPRKRLEAANQLSLIATYGTAPVAALAFSGIALGNEVLRHAFPHLGLDPKGAYISIWVDALSYLISGLVIWRLDFPKSLSRIAAEQPLWRSIVEGWRFIGGTPLIRGLVVGMLGAFAAGGLVIGLGQRFAADLGAGPAGYGVLFAAVFIGLAAGMWLGPRLLSGLSRHRLFGLSLVAAGVWLVLLSLVPNVVVATGSTFALGACGGVAWVSGYTLLGLEVDDELRGRTFSFVQSLVRVVLIAVLAIGPALAALLGAVFSLPHTVNFSDDVTLTYTSAMATFLVAGLFAVVVGVLSYRQMDDRRGTPLWADLGRALTRSGDLSALTPPRRPYPGFFIALEGGDGVGKSTQSHLLGEWLRSLGHEVVLTREPGGTPAGQQLRQIVLHGDHLAPRAEALIYAADRAHHVDAVIGPALRRGAVVVTDRFVDSSVAYQGAGRDLDSEEIARLSSWATRGLVPDLTVVLDLSAEEAMVRRGQSPDRLESEPSDFHDRVRERYLDLAREAPRRYLVVNAASTAEHIQDQVRQRLVQLLPESEQQRLDRERRESERRALEQQLAAQARADAEAKAQAEAQAQAQARAQAMVQAELAGREQAASRAAEAATREQEAAAAQPAGPATTQLPDLAAQEQAELAARAQLAAAQAPAPATIVIPEVPAEPATEPATPAAPTQQLPVVIPDPPPETAELAEEIFAIGVNEDPDRPAGER
jgi:dTMP kinase